MQKKPRQGSRRGSVSRAGISSRIGPLERRRADLARGLGYIKCSEGGAPKTPSRRAMPNRLAKWWQQWRWCWEQIIVVLLSFHERDSKIAYRGGEICVRGWRTPAGILIVSHGQDEFRELEALRAGKRGIVRQCE